MYFSPFLQMMYTEALLSHKTGYANQIIYPITITLIKLSLLLFYFRLFKVHEGFKVAIYITGVLALGWCVGIIFAGALQCLPVKQCLNGLGPPVTHHFSFQSYLLGYAIPNVTLDFVILVLPIFLVWNLVLTKRKKVAVSAVFLLGGFTCGASIARVYSVAYLDRLDITCKKPPKPTRSPILQLTLRTQGPMSVLSSGPPSNSASVSHALASPPSNLSLSAFPKSS